MLVHLAGELAGDLHGPHLGLEGAARTSPRRGRRAWTPGCAARSRVFPLGAGLTPHAPSIAGSERRSPQRPERRRPGRPAPARRATTPAQAVADASAALQAVAATRSNDQVAPADDPRQHGGRDRPDDQDERLAAGEVGRDRRPRARLSPDRPGSASSSHQAPERAERRPLPRPSATGQPAPGRRRRWRSAPEPGRCGERPGTRGAPQQQRDRAGRRRPAPTPSRKRACRPERAAATAATPTVATTQPEPREQRRWPRTPLPAAAGQGTCVAGASQPVTPPAMRGSGGGVQHTGRAAWDRGPGPRRGGG